jgi:hypothetical protein
VNNWRPYEVQDAKRYIEQYKKRVEDLYQERDLDFQKHEAQRLNNQKLKEKKIREEEQIRIRQLREEQQSRRLREDFKCLQDTILAKVDQLVVQIAALEVVPQEPEAILVECKPDVVTAKPEEAAAVPKLVAPNLQLSVADNISSLSPHISLIEETTKMIPKSNVKPFTMVLRSHSRNKEVARQFAEAPD